MYHVNFTKEAELDLSSTLEYISEILKSPVSALKLLSDAENKLKIFENFPLTFPLVHDEYLALKGIRCLTVNNYLVFYIVKEENKQVSIIRFLYGRRDWITLLKINPSSSI